MGCLFEKGVIVSRRECLLQKRVLASEESACFRREALV